MFVTGGASGIGSETAGAFARLEASLGPASVLVNNAARDDRHCWQDVTPGYWDEHLATNLRHIFSPCRRLHPE